MARFRTMTRRLQEGGGEACALYSAEPMDELTVKVILPAAPKVQGSQFVNWYIGFGEPDLSGLSIEAGISFSNTKRWNAFFNPEQRPDSLTNQNPGPLVQIGEREVDMTLIRLAGTGRVKFFVKPKGSVQAFDLSPTIPVIRPHASRMKIVSAASDVGLCSFGEVVMTVVKPTWFRPTSFLYRARGILLSGSPERLKVLGEYPELPSGFRTVLPAH